MKKDGELSHEQYQSMRSTRAAPGKFYGLPKTHEKDNPLQPVISNCGTYNYNVAKFLTNLLSPYSKSDLSYVKDSFEFVEFIRNRQINNDEEMVSIDVESLFTNVSTNETIDIIIRDLYLDNKLKNVTKISENSMRKLLKICTQEAHFMFNNEFYEQITPLGPLFANWFLKDFELKFIGSNLATLGIRLWKRYADIFAIVEINASNNILKYLNCKHGAIKFTMCLAEQARLQFLDTTVISDQTRSHYYTDIYHKPTDTGLYLLYDSCVAKEYKFGTINALLHRAWKICSDYKQFDLEVNRIRKNFQALCYPEFAINKCVKNFVEKRIETNIQDTTNKRKDEVLITLPYIGDISNRLVKQLNKTVQEAGLNTTVRGVFKGVRKINNYFKLKDKTPKLLQSNVVYSIKCLDCDAEYVGKTTQHIDARIYQHKIVKGGQHGLAKSHITEHSQRLGHQIDWQHYSILARASNDYYLKIKETLLIKERTPLMNNNETSVVLQLF